MGVGQVEGILGESNTASRAALYEESILVSWSKVSAFSSIYALPSLSPLQSPVHPMKEDKHTGNLPDQVRRHMARVMVACGRHFGSILTIRKVPSLKASLEYSKFSGQSQPISILLASRV